MDKKMNFDPETQAYFDSLPKMVQENIMMTSPDISCKEDLVRCVENLTNEQQ